MKIYDLILSTISLVCMTVMIFTESKIPDVIAAIILLIVASFRLGMMAGKELYKREMQE